MLLVAISEEGNIYRAAETLHMSQPAASKLVKDMEDVLGVPLFERLPRGMRPTPYGETMIRHARTALSCLKQAGAEVAARKLGHVGEVCVGAITGPAVSLLPQALARVARDHPGLRIQLIVEPSDVLMRLLTQAKLDIMIGRLFEQDDKTNLAYERLADEPICAVVRPGHPLLDSPGVGLGQLESASWIVPPPSSLLRHRFDLMFQEQGLSIPRHLMETSSLLFVTKMLEETDFVAVVARDVARHYASHGVLAVLGIELSCTMDAFGIITRKDLLLSPAAQLVLEAVKAVAAEIY